MLIKYEEYAEEWFYQITNWDGWLSILLEPFIEFNKEVLFKKTPLKLDVINYHSEIQEKILESYEMGFGNRVYAKDTLLEQHKNKISSFKMDNLEIIVNPDGGDFDYESLFDSQTKIRRYVQSDSGCTYITHYKIDIKENNQTPIVRDNKIAKVLIQFKSKPI